MFLGNGEGMEYLVRARVGGAKHTFILHLCIQTFWICIFLQKITPPKNFRILYLLNLLHAREARGNPIPPYATLRAARISGGETSLALKLESLLYSARTYFSKNLD